MFLVYLIKSDNKSYIGYTNDFFRRWKQHNCILKGGAKYTTRNNKHHWEPICIIDGFICKKEAMRCEWKLKRVKGYYKRLQYLSILIQKSDKWTKNSPYIKEQNLIIYVVDQYKNLFPFTTKELNWF